MDVIENLLDDIEDVIDDMQRTRDEIDYMVVFPLLLQAILHRPLLLLTHEMM